MKYLAVSFVVHVGVAKVFAICPYCHADRVMGTSASWRGYLIPLVAPSNKFFDREIFVGGRVFIAENGRRPNRLNWGFRRAHNGRTHWAGRSSSVRQAFFESAHMPGRNARMQRRQALSVGRMCREPHQEFRANVGVLDEIHHGLR